MLGKIIYISDNEAHIELNENIVVNDLINMHAIFEEENKKIVGEIQDINKNIIKIKYLGEFINNKFMGGVIRKPSINSNVRMLTEEELERIICPDEEIGNVLIGYSPLYNNHKIHLMW